MSVLTNNKLFKSHLSICNRCRRWIKYPDIWPLCHIGKAYKDANSFEPQRMQPQGDLVGEQDENLRQLRKHGRVEGS